VTRCTVEGCGKPHKARSLCATHYWKLRQYGDPTEVRHHPQQGVPCAVDGCDRPSLSKGWCVKHYYRVKKYGEPGPAGDLPMKQPYRSTHKWIRTVKGKASAHPCVDCGSPAEEWSYNHSDPNEVVDDNVHGRGVRCTFSLDPEFYEPRCKPCHRRFDQIERSASRRS